ncbi:MAG TPA: sulfatase-like hydrolase/transferase [Nitrobacter sp.]|nr:sulfatase-like hydrolase/transferase [Nitrobacter sp.]
MALAALVIWWGERSTAHLGVAVAGMGFAGAALLLVVADVERAMLLAALLAAAIVGASRIKYEHSGLKLMVTDLPLLFAGTARFFLRQYPLAVMTVAAGGLALLGATVATLAYAHGAPVAFAWRAAIFLAAAVGLFAAYRAGGGAAWVRPTAAQRRWFLSAFIASLADPGSWRQFGGLSLSDIADDPLPLIGAMPARVTDYPDIIFIQHESVFDPRLYGLPVDPEVAAFLSPQDGAFGALNVDIFGGGSWQSEFSVLTGLSSASFGSNAYFLFKRGVGRFHNTLPHVLAALGYKTTLVSSCRRGFLNYDAFYRAAGMNTRVFTDDLPPPFDLARFETTNSDAMFLRAVAGEHARHIADDASPRFLYALTNFNHGPHRRRLAASDVHARARDFAAASLPDPEYAEYYARLAETAAAWAAFRAELATRSPQRPTLVVHYGDHQPVMTRRIETRRGLPFDPQRQFRTFYAIESLQGADRLHAGRGRVLDIAFLGTVALQQAGLPLDEVFATRASLLDQCGEAYFASTSERKRRFHRTLVARGLIDIAGARDVGIKPGFSLLKP